MTNTYKEFLDFLDGAQNKKDIAGWETLHEFDHLSPNKDFDATVYKQGNRVVISLAGSVQANDYRDDAIIICRSSKIPSQYGDAERLYNAVKAKYPNAEIESVGYSLGGTISNLLSYRTGIKSTALAPIGSKHIADANPDYFKYGDSNITTYGRKADGLFDLNLKYGRQSGDINILPDLPKGYYGEPVPQHMLHNYNPYDISQAKKYDPKNSQRTKRGVGIVTGQAAPIENQDHIFTPEEIGKMTPKEFEQNESAIMSQMKNGQIKNESSKVDYVNYKNPENGTKMIYTREDISKMSTKEFSKYEKAINAKMKDIGIPHEKDVPKGVETHSRKQENSQTPDKGHWVTINGNHVLIDK